MGAFMDLRHGDRAQEVDAELRPGQGAVPQGLAGTPYRNGAGNHPSDYVSEPLFVPRDREWLDEQGRLVAHEDRLAAGTTNIAVSDAPSVADGPVRTLPAPESLGSTFHGQWVHA
ncbi:carotenoid oxygenase family protein [Streptomyces anulatus]|uniref:carotenoid oxygenase family protein n=1 Tax=Streptomyces anulatus TaxID=1892 RepID=UPI0036653AB9